MTQRIITDFPPLIDEIDAAFHVRHQHGVLYAWGDVIYNPTGVEIEPCLIAHEQVHGVRQGDDIAGWWRRYIEDRRFRFDEELAAHLAEYRYLITHGNRATRRAALKTTAARLAAPLYGRMVTRAKARALLSRA